MRWQIYCSRARLVYQVASRAYLARSYRHLITIYIQFNYSRRQGRRARFCILYVYIRTYVHLRSIVYIYVYVAHLVPSRLVHACTCISFPGFNFLDTYHIYYSLHSKLIIRRCSDDFSDTMFLLYI
jgi:hypothetical protein